MLATKKTNSSGNRIPGFTVVEVIATLVIIGILSAVAVSRVSSVEDYNLAAEVGIFETHLRYAQSRAMSDTVSWEINLSANSYTLQRNSDPPATRNLPNENSATHSLQAGVAINSSDGTITFDDYGSPGTENIDITLTAGGDSSLITVTANTGFIQ